MLVAICEGAPIFADDAAKGKSFTCPNCKRHALLHQGPIKIAHFKHKSKGDCKHGVGETEEHRLLKVRFKKEWEKRGFESNLEEPVRRAGAEIRFLDVSIKKPPHRQFAIEIVHKNDGLGQIIEKNDWFLRERIIPVWVSVIRPDHEQSFEATSQGLTVVKYSPSAFEKWAHGLNFGELYFAFARGIIICAKFQDHMLMKGDSTYFDADAKEEITSFGGPYASKRYRDLKIMWKRGISDIAINLRERKSLKSKNYTYPCGLIGRLVPR